MKNTKYVFLIFLAALAMSGCANSADISGANTTVASLYSAVSSKDWDGALSHYHADFLSVTPKDNWKQFLERVNRKLGDFVEYKVIGADARRQYGSNAGTFVTINCHVKYSKYEANEQLILRQRSGESGFQIIKHVIASPELMKD
jgi:hypothetical protein